MSGRSWRLLGHAAVDFVILWAIGFAVAVGLTLLLDLRSPWPFIVGMICGAPSGIVTVLRDIDRRFR